MSQHASSVASPSPAAASTEAPPQAERSPRALPRHTSGALSLALGCAFAGVAFAAQGGSELSRTTIVEIALTLASGAVVTLALLRARAGRSNGGLTVAAFAAFAAFTALSILWSIVPELSWLEANRTFAYLAVFTAAVACARLAPDGYAVLLRGILVGTFVIVAYALASRIWPATLASDEIYARLGQPYGYWNALGATAALAVPPALWLGSRRSGHAAVNALAYPLLTLSVVAMFLSYSRGALVFAGAGALVWLALVPLRLRSLAVLAVSLAGAAPIVIWTLSKDAFTKNQVPLAVRESISTQFGVFVVATAIVVLAVALVVQFRVGRRPPRLPIRLAVGGVAVLVACAVPIGLFAVLVSSDRGLTGTIKADYESLTSSTGKTPGGPSRLTTASNSRGRYWHQAKEVFVHNELRGTGAGTYGIARLRYRNDDLVAQHAHGYVMQTEADFGVIGLVLTVLLLVTWLVAAVRATAVTIRPRRRLPYGADRAGLVALSLAAIVYGLHSAIDWIWFVPGPTVMALAAAGFVAGRGPLRLRFAGPAPAPKPAEPRPLFVAPPFFSNGSGNGHYDPEATQVLVPRHRRVAAAVASGGRAAARPLRKVAGAPRPLLAAGAVAVTLLSAWTIWQPLRSDNASNHALDLSARGGYGAAFAATRDARSYDPLTPKPLVVRASIENQRGDRTAALHDLEAAVNEYRGDPQVWLQLAEYQLGTLGDPAAARNTLRGALFLDPQSPEAQTDFFAANQRLTGAPAAAPAGAGALPQAGAAAPSATPPGG